MHASDWLLHVYQIVRPLVSSLQGAEGGLMQAVQQMSGSRADYSKAGLPKEVVRTVQVGHCALGRYIRRGPENRLL